MKNIKTVHAGRTLGVGYVSFQADGSISFGLKDKTYVSPDLGARIGLWNAYNQVTIEYESRRACVG
jgi:hypothetical protein